MKSIINFNSKTTKITSDETLTAIWVGVGEQRLETELNFIHEKADVVSNILIKAVLFDKSQLDIFANLIINKGAKNVDGYLKIDVLLMSDRAEARAIPSLEVFEDNVKGGHGASIGPIDKDQLFYLQSKGLNKNEAEKLIAEGFLEEAIVRFKNEVPLEIKKQLEKFTSLKR